MLIALIPLLINSHRSCASGHRLLALHGDCHRRVALLGQPRGRRASGCGGGRRLYIERGDHIGQCLASAGECGLTYDAVVYDAIVSRDRSVAEKTISKLVSDATLCSPNSECCSASRKFVNGASWLPSVFAAVVVVSPTAVTGVTTSSRAATELPRAIELPRDE